MIRTSAGDEVRSKHKEPTIIALVLNWNGYRETEKCILSLEKVAQPKLEIVIIDNGSDDRSGQSLRERFRTHHFIHCEMNGGYAGGNNAGIRYALSRGADLIVIINNDVVVDPRFLEPMVNVLMDNDSIGAVTCRAYFDSDKSRLYGTGGHVSYVRCAGVGLKESESNVGQEVEFISGCVLLIRSKVFSEVGFFDERFFMYFEDLEFSRRLVQRYKLWYVPQAVVYHASGAGQRWNNYTPLYLYYNTRNRFLAFRNDHWMYRMYVFLYSVLNCTAKAFVILLTNVSHGYPSASAKRHRALWNGLVDGIVRREGIREVRQ